MGRQSALGALDDALISTADGVFQFVALVGEPGAGKSRLLGELTSAAVARDLSAWYGRAAEFEQQMPFGGVVDALDDHLEEYAPDLDPTAAQLLATVFPSLSVSHTGDAAATADQTGLARYRLYRSIRHLLEGLAAPSGMVLILDDVHWADDSTAELLDHLVRHPPRGRVLIAVAYRPAQTSPRLATLVESAGGCGRRISVDPFTRPEVEEFLGPRVSPTQREALYEASGGNPFYLEALARIGRAGVPAPSGDARGLRGTETEMGQDELELPPAVRAALQAELGALPEPALLIARAAAVAADEFEPALAATAAEVSESAALDALDELVARDVVRPATAGRFRFRHPLVRHAIYGSAAAGWRLAVHARIADHLAQLGAPATQRAHHVERSARYGDHTAITTLVQAARTVAPQAPSTAAHWLRCALQLMPDDAHPEPGGPPGAQTRLRLELLTELAQVQSVSGRVEEGRETAREVLRLLPPTDYARRARAARFCALMERLLGRPHQARALLLDELRAIPDQQSAAALPLRMRLVAESMMRADFRAAQAVLDLVPERFEEWEPSLQVAVAALRVLPALASGRISDAVQYVDIADGLVTSAPDEHLADWLDAIAWLCWAEIMMGRYRNAQAHFERGAVVARSTGQSYIVSSLLAGQARATAMLGQVAEAVMIAEDAAESARLVGSRQQLVVALTQQCLAASWSGDDAAALRLGAEAVNAGEGSNEAWVAAARYGWARALIMAGQTEQGAATLTALCDGAEAALLDQWTLLSAFEVMAELEAARNQPDEARGWADRAAKSADPALPVNGALALLAQSHALRNGDPAVAAAHAQRAAEVLTHHESSIEAGRARLSAGLAAAEAGDRAQARTELRMATELFSASAAETLLARTVRAQRRLGVKVPSAAGRRASTAPFGLSRRELEVANLVAEGHTNQQIAEKLFISVRTIETHISHIFAKLEVTSRVSMVHALAQRDDVAEATE